MRALVGMLSAMALALALTTPANAATFKPTRFDDPEPDRCKPNNCSLREAISAAREDTDTKDKVALSKGRYLIERPDDATDDNDNGDFDVFGPTTIVGKGKKTIVDGNGVDEVFTLLGFDKRTIKNLTITGGISTGGGGGVSIGPSKATLSKVVIKGNTAADGAGVRSVSPDLSIKKSTITGNTATGPGGGIYIPVGLVAVPGLTIRDSTISGNSGTNGGGMMFGSAGSGDDPVGSVVNSTFAENQATVDGGGIAAIEGADLEVHNSSIGDNRANSDEAVSGRGGGIFQSTGAFFELADSVLSSNSAGIPGGQEFGCAAASPAPAT